jgi:lactoylglutathione lyase
MTLKLLVIKTTDIDKLVTFYQLIGLSFDKHQHGRGVVHYATTIKETVFEIYPLPKSVLQADNSMRLGFEIKNLYELITELERHNVKINSYPKQTEFGLMAIVEDFDGRKIELYHGL